MAADRTGAEDVSAVAIDDDAFLRGLLVSMGATEFDASTVDCLRQIAIEQFSDVIGTANRFAMHAKSSVITPEAVSAACALHAIQPQPIRERLMDKARIMNGRAVAWPITGEVMVPIEAVPETALPAMHAAALTAATRAAIAAGSYGAGPSAIAAAGGGSSSRFPLHVPKSLPAPVAPAAGATIAAAAALNPAAPSGWVEAP